MKVVIGLIFIGMILMVFLGWVIKMGRFGFMMIGMTICVPAFMGCVLNLKGEQRLWAVAPAVAFFILVFFFYDGWNKLMKK
jgi:hypothetical protein